MIGKLKKSYWELLHRWNTLCNPTEVEFWMYRVSSILGRLPHSRVKEKVLDVGGGNGRMKKHLCHSQSLNYTILERVGWDGERLPFDKYLFGDITESSTSFIPDNASFDLIGCFEVLEHLTDPRQAFINMAELLKPGGYLILSTPQYWHIHGWPNDYFRYTSSGLRLLAKNAGLKEVALWPMGGPCLMIWTAIELNFRHPLRWPIVCQLVTWPAIMMARLLDWMIFSRQENWKHFDTRGWIGIWRMTI